MPGWNDYVREHFRAALFWHNIWVDNGRPTERVVAEVRRSTRRTYHKVCKMAMRHAGEIACDKMAQSIRCNSMREFWNEAKRHRRHKINYPNVVDG